LFITVTNRLLGVEGSREWTCGSHWDTNRWTRTTPRCFEHGPGFDAKERVLFGDATLGVLHVGASRRAALELHMKDGVGLSALRGLQAQGALVFIVVHIWLR